MSVLIKGMEMPNSCYDCRFFVDAWCYAFGTDDCRNAYNKPPKGERLDNCPLVGIPIPHGDLIDKDATMNAILEERGEDTACWFAGIVNDMPAVIRSDNAEDGE